MTLALDRDAALALVAAACAATAITLLAAEQPRESGGFAVARPAVGTVAEANKPLRLRSAEELGWRNIAAGAEVRERDALFVPPATAARLSFKDGTTLELDERSLVVIEAPRGRKTVALRQGSFAGVAGNDGMLVQTPQGTAQVAPSSQLQVALGQGGKVIQPCEQANQPAVRRSIVARRDLPRGSLITQADLDWIRPGGGLSPGNEYLLIGRRLARAVSAGEALTPETVGK